LHQRPLEGIHPLPVRFHQRLQSRGTDRAGIQFLLLVGAHGLPGRRGLGPGRDYGFYLQFVLRGLGGIGKNIDQLLQDSIFGFGST
jgi:hypothetical protein